MEDKDVRTSALNVEEFWWAAAILVNAIANSIAPEKRQEIIGKVATHISEAADGMPAGKLRGISRGLSLHLMHFES